MAWKHKRTVDTTTSYPTGMPTYSRIGSMVKQIMNASQYDYHESEAFEVKEVILNEPGNRGSVKGTFINNPNQEILGGVVKPLMPNVVTVPVVGEHVVAIEYNGQHYYTSIINRKGSINENSIPGASGTYEKNTKYGKTFERKNVKPLQIGEGCVLYEGRFGQSVHFDGHNNVPSIKIRTNIDTGDGDFTTEDIDTDDSSIYLTSDGLSGTEFDGEQIKGKKILIKSDGIFIKGSGENGEVRIIGDQSINLNSDQIKIGNGANQSVVKGDELKKVLLDLISALEKATYIGVAPGSPTTPAVNVLEFTSLRVKLETILSNKVKTS
jgi:hypothetical protein